jgi:hypothetical protein
MQATVEPMYVPKHRAAHTELPPLPEPLGSCGWTPATPTTLGDMLAR